MTRRAWLDLDERVEKLEAAALDHSNRLHAIERNGVLARLAAIEARLDTIDPHIIIGCFEPAKTPSHPKKEGRRPRKPRKLAGRKTDLDPHPPPLSPAAGWLLPPPLPVNGSFLEKKP